MYRSNSTFFLLGLSFILSPIACGDGKDPGAPEVSENYGDDLIGYKLSAEARQLSTDAPDSDPVLDASGDGDGYGDGDLSFGTGGGFGAAAGGAVGAGGNQGTGSGGDAVALGGYGGSTLSRETPGRVRTAQVEPELSLLEENPFVSTSGENTSTFSIDADSGSYTLSRGSVNAGVLPNPESVRVEEFLNYFHFHYKQPTGSVPLSVYTEWSACPWNEDRDLLMIGVQGQEVNLVDAPPLNLVYLLDVSGSMNSPLKLPLLLRGFRMLTSQLRAQDRVSIVTYAGADRVILEGAYGSEKARIDTALVNLRAGGSTNGAGGIQRAYELAEEYYIEGGMNRVLLATDGDFNVGTTDVTELVDLILQKRQTGVYLSVYGYGAAWNGGNFRDEVGEQLADNGNGIYFYIDGPEETQRAFMHTASGSLITVAKDVKLQLEFNSSFVKGYRLIGYENRVLSNSAFNDDSVDAGELGAGLSVTALYEIIRADSQEALPEPKPLTVPELAAAGEGTDSVQSGFASAGPSEMAQLRLRYKESESVESKALSFPVRVDQRRQNPTLKFLFAAGISEFAMQLRGSQYLPSYRFSAMMDQMERTLLLDGEGAIAEALQFVERAQDLR